MSSSSGERSDRTYLFGFMPLEEAEKVFLGDLGNNLTMSQLHEHWLSKVASASGLAQSDPYLVNDANISRVLTDFEDSLLPKVAKIMNRLRQSEFWRNLKFSIKLIDPDYLVALQNNVNLARIERLRLGISESPEIGRAMDLCFDFERKTPPIDWHMVAEDALLFSSPDDDVRMGKPQVRMLPAVEGEEGLGKMQVPSFVLPVRGGDPIVAAIQTSTKVRRQDHSVETQYWFNLQNGFHRVYALKSLGLRYVPCAIIEPSSPQETRMLTAGWSPERQQQLHSLRPPLLKDFSNPDLTETLSIPTRRVAWRVSWKAERLTT